jgi:hypothetical protein
LVTIDLTMVYMLSVDLLIAEEPTAGLRKSTMQVLGIAVEAAVGNSKAASMLHLMPAALPARILHD